MRSLLCHLCRGGCDYRVCMISYEGYTLSAGFDGGTCVRYLILELNTIVGEATWQTRANVWCQYTDVNACGLSWSQICTITVKTVHSDLISVTLYFSLFPCSCHSHCLYTHTHTHTHTNNTCDCDFPQGHSGWSSSKVNTKHNTRPINSYCQAGREGKENIVVLGVDDLSLRGPQKWFCSLRFYHALPEKYLLKRLRVSRVSLFLFRL